MHKPQWIILMVALAARLGVLALVAISGAGLANPLDSRAFNGGDSEQYIRLAQNLVEHSAFSLQTEPPFTPDLIRTPGYPLLLAGLYGLAGHQHNPLLIVAVQVALSLLNVWLILSIGKKLFNPTVAYTAGLIYALAPAALIFTGLVMTETLFATLLLISLRLVITVTDDTDYRAWLYALAAGFCFALGVYIRPIGLYAAPLLALALLVRLGFNRRAFGLSLALLAAYGLSIAPWYLRNYAHYQAVLFTSLANQNLLMYNLSSIEAQRQGLSWREAKDQLWAEYQQRLTDLKLTNPNEAQISQIMGDLALEHVRANPLSAAFYQFTDMSNALRPGYSMAALLLRDEAKTMGDAVQSGNLEAITASTPPELIIFGLMTAYYALLYSMVIIGIVVLIFRRQWFALFLCGLIPFWFLFQPGAAGNARFRAPVEGLLALLAAVGLLWLVKQMGRLPLLNRVRHLSLEERS